MQCEANSKNHDNQRTTLQLLSKTSVCII